VSQTNIEFSGQKNANHLDDFGIPSHSGTPHLVHPKLYSSILTTIEITITVTPSILSG
jgi:hypothetical protein